MKPLPNTRKELAEAYGVSSRTMRFRIVGLVSSKIILTPKELAIIAEKFGVPAGYKAPPPSQE